jgi:serine protease
MALSKIFYASKLGALTFGFFAPFSLPASEIPWHLANNANSAIQTTQIQPGPHAVVVAIIDSGILPNHPSLAQQVLPGYDMLSGQRNLRGARSADVTPDSRNARCGNNTFTAAQRTHGTEVASVIAGNGKAGVVGVNPDARILPIRTMGACGMTRTDLLDAMAWAAGLPVTGAPVNPHPARIINLSLAGGGTTCGPELQALINKLTQRNVFVVAAAGNNFQKALNEPANCQGVISVGAVDADNRITDYSALDPRTTIYAPGGTEARLGQAPAQKLRVATFEQDIWGQERATASDRGVGTSFAAALVTGFISLWISYKPQIAPADFFTHLSKFTREVEQIQKCVSCEPRGLTASKDLFFR